MIGATVAILLAAQPSATVDLRWPGRSRAPVGRAYIASLKPEGDGSGGIESIQLALRHRIGRRERNLVEPTRFWHGVQPFIFNSWDFMHGVAASLYGAERVLSIRGSRDTLRVQVVSARSGTAQDWTGGKAGASPQRRPAADALKGNQRFTA